MQQVLIDNPATLRRLGEVPDSDAGAVDAAVAGARAALAQWQRLGIPERERALRGVAARLRGTAAGIARLLSEESGKPLCEARDCLQAAAALFDLPAEPQLPEPGAVVAVLVPASFPLLLLAAASSQALAAGHVVVAKLPTRNPLACLQLATLLDGLPDGVLTLLTGGSATGMMLACHRGVDRIDFTGSAAAARALAAAVPDKPIQVQAGGVDACIVSADADLDLAVPGIAWSRLNNAGQAALTFGHLYVDQSIAREFVDRMHQFVGFLDVDDPLHAGTDIGPLVALQAAQRVEDQVGRALRDGARLILGGRRFRPSGLPGHFFQPTILTDVPAGSTAAREAILGPVITVTPVPDRAAALQAATRAEPGCGVALYTRDVAGALHDTQSVAVAAVRINDPPLGSAGPFSGLRHAGVLRALGGVRPSLPGTPGVQVAATLEAKPWWFPYAARGDPA
jgi:betaine-aldehyde dehydrogenase